MAYNIANLPGLIALGNQNEKGANSVQFDVSAWATLYPTGTYSITYTRPGETTVYPEAGSAVSVATVGLVTTLTWTPSDAVLDVAGQGTVVIHCTENGVEKRSAMTSTIVTPGHGAEGTPPEPLADYIEKWGAVDIAVTGLAAGEEPTGAVTQDANGTHLALGIPKGDTGATGATGPQGIQGVSAYAQAVAGGYTGSEAEFLADLAATDGLASQLAANANKIAGLPTNIVWRHPNGDGEMVGSNYYRDAAMIGWAEQMLSATVVNRVELPVYVSGLNTFIEWKVYVISALATINLGTAVPVASGTLMHAQVNRTSGALQTIVTPDIAVAANQWVVYALKASAGNLNVRYWLDATAVSGRHSYFMKVAAGWTGNLSKTDYPQFGQVAMRLSYDYAYSQSKIISGLPATIPAVVGHEVNIYFANVIYATDNIDLYRLNVVCAKGTQQNERWTYVPEAADAGNVSLSIEIYRDDALYTTLTTTVVVVADTVGGGSTPVELIIGDSLTAGGQTVTEINTLYTADPSAAITFIGTKGGGADLHEGIGGWTSDAFYTNASSPFVFSGAFNFAQYLSTNGLATPDRVVIHLGINDMFSYLTDATAIAAIATYITQVDAMITNIKAANANVKIGVCLPVPPSASQDAFGKNYYSNQTQWRYRRNNALIVRQLIDYYGGQSAQGIYLVPLNVNLDTVNNMDTETVAVNSRNSTTVVRQANGLHPKNAGYYQIADSLYNWNKWLSA